MLKKNKVVVIGLDGAPFETIKDLSNKGILPNLTKLIEKGSGGCLLSSFLPESPIAWTSIITGKNPAKHGIFDWTHRKDNSYRGCVRT